MALTVWSKNVIFHGINRNIFDEASKAFVREEKMKNFLIVAAALLISLATHADEKKNLINVPVSNVLDQSAQYTDEKFTLELFSYEENIYSQSRKTELGDQLKLNTRFRYQMNDSAWVSMGFKTRPDVDRFANKTSDFEVRSGYSYGKLVVQADLSIDTDDGGGISFGMDLDSENTFLRYALNDKFKLTFFPFNFDGEVGVEFQTFDVTRIYYVQGTPSAIGLEPDPNDPANRLINKTLPGFVLNYNNIEDKNNFTNFYIGLGAATYEYPNDPSFDIRVGSIGTEWSREEVLGYKLGGVIRRPNSFSSFQFVSQSEDRETGVLLKSAASLYNLSRIGNNFMLEFEVTSSQGGRTPYRVDFRNDWFATSAASDFPIKTAQQRVYSDITGSETQDWAGEWGFAQSLRLGVKKEGYTPYISYKYLDENFVFSGDESAHVLRTNDLSESHGGLHKVGVGAYIYNGNFIINPRFDYMIANNDVFVDSNRLTDFDATADLSDTDFLFFINVSYFYNKRTGPRTFRL